MTVSIEYPKSILESKLFLSLKDSEIQLLIKDATMKMYKVNEVVLKEGDKGEHFYWIASGKVDVKLSPATFGSQPLLLTTLGTGDVLGEMGLLGFTRRAASAIVTESAQIYVWNLQKTLELFMSNPVIGYRVTRNLAYMLGERLVDTNKQLRGRSEMLDSNLAKTVVSDYKV